MLKQGDILSGYRIESVLGRGGMGVVYRAHQTSMDRYVALKVLSAEFLHDEAFRQRFRREGRIASQLDHPNILPVFEADEAEGLLFIVMRLVDGPTMGDLIAEQGALRWQRVIEILAPIASALDAAGGAGLVHRDVKPQNILISSGGHPYLADFGLMRLARSGGGMTRGMTRSGEWLGSPDYAAPEHMTDQNYTAAGDVYSLTAVAFHALTGHVAYDRRNDLAVLHAHASAPRPKISSWNPVAPARLDEVIAWGMATNASERPASASVFMAELAAALRSTPIDPVLVKEAQDNEDGQGPPALHRSGRTTKPFETVPGHPPTSDVRTVARDTAGRAEAVAGPTVAERRPSPRDERPAGRARTSRRLAPAAALMIAGALMIALVAAALADVLGGDENAPAQRVHRASFNVELPSGWRIDRRPSLRTLALTQSVVARTTPSVVLDAGHLDKPRGGPDPLPIAHAARWARRAQADRVRIGAIGALRYDATLASGLSAERTYVVPTTRGYLAVSCRGPKGALARLRKQCDQVAGTLQLRGARSVPPSPSPVTARGVGDVMQTLDQARAKHAGGLVSGDLRRRARAAQLLGNAHARAASRLADVQPGPQDRRTLGDLKRAVTTTGTNLQRLATAASRGERARYEALRVNIRIQDRELQETMSQLRSARYRIVSSGKR